MVVLRRLTSPHRDDGGRLIHAYRPLAFEKVYQPGLDKTSVIVS